MNEARQLADLAWSMQRRMETLADNVDPSWHNTLGLAAWMSVAGLGTGRTALSRALARRCFDPLPPLETLPGAAGSLALLDRQQLLSRLCALALLGRPGVLRCCVERQARTALQRELGPAYAALYARGNGASSVRPEVAAWSPLAWAWVGYRELVRENAWPHRSLRRMARLALPASHDDEPPRRSVPAAISPPAQRLDALDALYQGGLPC